MKHIVPIVMLLVSSLVYPSEEGLSVWLPLKNTVMDEYKRDVRVPNVKNVAVPTNMQLLGASGIYQVNERKISTWQSPGNVKTNIQNPCTQKSTTTNTERIVIPSLSEETMTEIKRGSEVSASINSTQPAVIRRLGESGGGMGSESGDDPNRSELSPIGEGWILLLFAMGYGVIGLRKNKREITTRDEE